MTTLTRPCPAPSRAAGLRAAGASVLAALFLAACGGDYDSPVPPPPPPPPPPPITQVPASAAADDASWEAFAISQPPTEDTEPLTLELITTVPSSETEEPIALP